MSHMATDSSFQASRGVEPQDVGPLWPHLQSSIGKAGLLKKEPLGEEQ